MTMAKTTTTTSATPTTTTTTTRETRETRETRKTLKDQNEMYPLNFIATTKLRTRTKTRQSTMAAAAAATAATTSSSSLQQQEEEEEEEEEAQLLPQLFPSFRHDEHDHEHQIHHKNHHHQHHPVKGHHRSISLATIVVACLLLIIQPDVAATAKSSKTKKNSNIHHSDEKPVLEGQRFAMEPQDQTAVVGSRVTLPCRVVEKVGALQWTKDDFGLGQHRNLSGFERYSMVGSDEEGDFSLDIYPVMLDDDAKYQCQVGPGPQGESGIRSRFAKLTVLVPPEDPKILQGDYLVTTEDREIELECVSVGGKPAAEITWIDGLGNVLTKGIEYVKESLADSRRITAKSILKLAPKKEHHNTTFTCQAQNTADRTYRSAKLLLEVKYAPKVAVSVVSGALAGGHIPEGSEVILSCQADANPHELNYRWFLNDDLMTGDYTTKMIIHNVTRQYHDAIVKCEVVNAVGKSEESETLDISYGPIFQKKPTSVEADQGSTVKLNCEVDGNPPPEIEWIHENSDRVVGTGSTLELKVSSETAGRYYCKAVVEGFPEIGAEASLYLKRAPLITSQKVQFGAIGTRAKIECRAFSIPKAEQIIWSFEDRVINVSTADPDVYIFEEQHLQEGVRAALTIRESRSTHYGKYNCTVINSYGSDSLLITLIPEPGSVPVLLVVMGSISSVAIVLMVVMLVVVYMRHSRKKHMPADVIPPEAARGADKLADLKSELRAKAYVDVDYSEAGNCVVDGGSGGVGGGGGGGGVGTTIQLTHAPLPDVQMKAGSSSIKLDERFTDEFCHSTRNLANSRQQCLVNNQKNKESGNGYAPYFEYAMDYNMTAPPPDVSQQSGNTGGGGVGGIMKTNNSLLNSATLPHYSNPPINVSSSSSSSTAATTSNLSLPRNRTDMQQQQQHVSQTATSSQGGSGSSNGFLGQALLQNGIDSRYSAVYSNPYLRTNSSSMLPPLPPPSTANPAATPAPPPYHAPRNMHHHHHHPHQHPHQHHAHTNGGIGGIGLSSLKASLIGGSGSMGCGSSNMGSSAIGSGIIGCGSNGLGSVSGSSSNLTGSSSNTLAAMTPLNQPSNGGSAASAVAATIGGGAGSPSGQFILPSNGSATKKGALATHV